LKTDEFIGILPGVCRVTQINKIRLMTIQLNLTIEEVNSILSVLGQLPTSSGAYPLLTKIRKQGEDQVPAAPAAPESNGIPVEE
jgi:hypothetical protein